MDILIEPADWDLQAEALLRIRYAVFVREQGVPADLEADGHDPGALHLLASNAQHEGIATARLLTDGHIGRMAVLPSWRRKGIGTALLETLMNTAAHRSLPLVYLNAQCTAADFYARLGFESVGREFQDAGIPHIRMVRRLSE